MTIAGANGRISTGSFSILRDASIESPYQAAIKAEAAKRRSNPIAAAIAHWTALIVQVVCYPLFYAGYNTAFKLEIHGAEKLKDVKGPVLFISNHIAPFDSFLFDIFVSPFSKLPPFRFMGTTRFAAPMLKILNALGIVGLIYLLFGVLKVTRGQGVEKAVAPAVDVVKKGGTVCVFPEGQMWDASKNALPIGPFKWGAAHIALQTSVQIIPVALKREGKRTFRDRLVASIGDAYHADMSSTPEHVADDMRHKVLELHTKIRL